MTVFEKYTLWLNKLSDRAEKAELEAIRENEKEISDRFYTDLEFGTAGLRGVVGMGSNRMNKYTVGRAAQGLATWLLENGGTKRVVIGRDPRHFSLEFARESAAVLAANGITVYLFPDISPTPLLAFAIRYLRCGAGIMITASHNPREYNGFKCYGADGGQMTDDSAGQVLRAIESTDIFTGIKSGGFDDLIAQGFISYAPAEVYEAFLQNAMDLSIHPEAFEAGLSVLYTPLNGAGSIPVTEVLTRMGLKNLHIVASQEKPDGDFPTCPYPNPEMRPAFDEAIKQAQTLHPELIIATDPDSDRLACAVRRGDSYAFLSGNEVGCLLVYYMLTELRAAGRLPENPLIIKTIVSTRLTDRICKDLGCQLMDVLTGFKYVAEQVLLLEKAGKESRFIMGFEESVGYLFGTKVRDKDAVAGAMLLCEMASFWKLQGKDLVDVLLEIYAKYGRFFHKTLNLVFPGAEGREKMAGIMDALRHNPPQKIGGRKVLGVEDYLPGLRGLPKSNVLVFDLGDGYSAIARPSGTEPKLKFYLTAVGLPEDDGERLLHPIATDLTEFCGVS